MTVLPTRSEVWWCEPPSGSPRPVVVLSRNAAIRKMRRALVAPCTTHFRELPTEVMLEPATDPLPVAAAVSLDALHNVAVETLTERLGRLSHDRMRELCEAVMVAIDCQ